MPLLLVSLKFVVVVAVVVVVVVVVAVVVVVVAAAAAGLVDCIHGPIFKIVPFPCR